MNQIEQLRQTAKGIWPYLLPLIKSEFGDALRFYQATVVANPGSGMLAVQQAAGPVRTIPCSAGLENAEVGYSVLVLCLGTRESDYRVAVCGADPNSFSSTITDPTGSGGSADPTAGVTQEEMEAAIEEAQENQHQQWLDEYEQLYNLVMATSGQLLPLPENHTIVGVLVEYYLSTSRTTLDGGSWTANEPEPRSGWYLWTRLAVTFVDSEGDTQAEYTDPVCAVGPGTWSVWRIDQLFLVSPNRVQLMNTELDPAVWQTRTLAVGEGEYLWTRQRIFYTENPDTEDGSTLVGTTYTEPYCLSDAISDATRQAIADYSVTIDGETYNFADLVVQMKESFLAKSEFGSYLQQLVQEFSMTAEGMEQDFTFFSDLKRAINSLSDSFESYVNETNGYIRSGVVDWTEDHVPVFGIAIGQNLRTVITPVDGGDVTEITKEGFRALYTASGLSFWQDDKCLAYMSNNKLHITDVAALRSFSLGEWSVSGTPASRGLTLRWVGGS